MLDVDFNGLMSTLATNSAGPLVVAKHLSPLLQKGLLFGSCVKSDIICYISYYLKK